MLQRYCEGAGACSPAGIKKGEKIYRVKGPRTAFEWKEIPLCDTCPDAMRKEGHLIEEVIR